MADSATAGRRGWWKIAVGLVAVVAVVGVGYWLLGRGAQVTARVVGPEKVLRTVLGNGVVAGGKLVSLAFLRGGVVASIPVMRGGRVAPGDTLVILDNRDERNAIAQRRAALKQARAALAALSSVDAEQAREQLTQARSSETLARRQVGRLEGLVEGDAVAKAELETARRDLELATSRRRAAESRVASLASTERRRLEAQRDQALAALRQSEVDLSRTVLRALESGTVVDVPVAVGELAAAGARVVSFLPADTTTHIELRIDETEIDAIRKGQRALVSVASRPERTYGATVSEIRPLIDASRGVATVHLAVDSLTERFFPDQTVTAEIVTDTLSDALVVEQRFLLFEGDVAQVFVLREGRVRKQLVEARAVGGARFAITAGLVAGDTVVQAMDGDDGARVEAMVEEP